MILSNRICNLTIVKIVLKFFLEKNIIFISQPGYFGDKKDHILQNPMLTKKKLMKKILNLSLAFIFLSSFLFTFHSCKEDPTLSSVSTAAVTDISRTAATSGGDVTGDGGAAVISRGVCWDTAENPTVDNNKTSDGSGTGPFTSSITQLTPGTTYYVRAYAENEVGIVYGNQRTFTSGAIVTATLSTKTIESITSSAAMTGGDITDDGGGNITARGVCWSTGQSPTIDDNKTNDGSGSGSFTSEISGLDFDTEYYVRAYATNSAGTAYGNELSFTTEPLKDADGNTYTTVEIGSQVWMVENLRTTTLNDGTKLKAENDIPLVTDNTTWTNLTTPAYCWYENDEETYGSYGALYNWYAVNNGDLCPPGWHVASKSDWDAMLQYLIDNGFNYDGSTNTPISENKLAKALASSTGWTSSNNTGVPGNSDYPDKINVTGFSAWPGGYRSVADGSFRDRNAYGYWWTSSSSDEDNAHCYTIMSHWDQVDYYEFGKKYGLSVKCVKD